MEFLLLDIGVYPLFSSSNGRPIEMIVLFCQPRSNGILIMIVMKRSYVAWFLPTSSLGLPARRYRDDILNLLILFRRTITFKITYDVSYKVYMSIEECKFASAPMLVSEIDPSFETRFIVELSLPLHPFPIAGDSRDLISSLS